MKNGLIYLVLSLLYCSVSPIRAFAAFGDFVQKATAAANLSATSLTIGGAGNWPSNLTAGNAVIIGIRIGATGRTVTVTSDSTPGGTEAVSQVQTVDGHTTYIFHSLNQAGGVKATFTIAISGAAASIRAVAGEFVGSSNTHLDKTASSQGNSTSPSSGTTAARTDATELQIGGFSEASGLGAFTAGSGFTTMDNIADRVGLEYVTRASTGTQAADGTLSFADDWTMLTATYSDSAGGGGGTAKKRMMLLGVGP